MLTWGIVSALTAGTIASLSVLLHIGSRRGNESGFVLGLLICVVPIFLFAVARISQEANLMFFAGILSLAAIVSATLALNYLLAIVDPSPDFHYSPPEEH